MREIVLAASGLLAAVGASTCCVIPVALGTMGVGSAFASSLSVLAPYQTVFRLAAVVLLGGGFWLVYARSPVQAGGEACAPSRASGWTKPVLWAGTAVMALVFTSAWWERWLP